MLQESCTPLHVACLKGNLELVKLLLENNSDYMIQNKVGFTKI